MSGPFVTAAVPGCGGVFRASPEDFRVEELPAYLPSGEGEHLFLWITKRGLSTPEAAARIAAHLGIAEKDVSWAGLKDRHAVTAQFLCVPARAAGDRWASFPPGEVTIVSARRHGNKLKGGHLEGNRFELAVREVVDRPALEASVAMLERTGLANRFGEQRFGARDDNAARGKALLLAGGRMRDRFRRKLLLSAYQSSLFNRVLAARLEDGLFTTALAGDVMKKHLTGGEFVCEDPGADQPRLDAFELSPTGPMFGPDMRRPLGVVEEREARVLAEEGVSLAQFAAGGDETRGTRRLLRVPVKVEVDWLDAATARLRFQLPAGSYATVLVAELLKR